MAHHTNSEFSDDLQKPQKIDFDSERTYRMCLKILSNLAENRLICGWIRDKQQLINFLHNAVKIKQSAFKILRVWTNKARKPKENVSFFFVIKFQEKMYFFLIVSPSFSFLLPGWRGDFLNSPFLFVGGWVQPSKSAYEYCALLLLVLQTSHNFNLCSIIDSPKFFFIIAVFTLLTPQFKVETQEKFSMG